MQAPWQYLRYALRRLRRSPGFALTVVATLGIGIGLNAAIFTVVDCVLLRPLGYHDADRIVALRTHLLGEGRSIPRMGGDDYRDLAQQVHGLEATAFYQSYPDGMALRGEALYLPVANVSPRFGQVMGVEPVAGRLFAADDAAGSGAGRDALVSLEFARDHFGSAQAALGQVLQWTGAPRTIVGVLPDGFSFPGETKVWFEAGANPQTASRTSYSQQVVGKRRAGISEQQLAAELAAFSRHLETTFPEDARKSIESVSLQEQLVGEVRPVLRLLMGSVAVLLLIVCANVTHLQLVRGMQQLRSVTIRTALGASRATLAGRALLEAWLLATAGCAAALLLAIPALGLLVRLAPADTPRLADIHLNLHVLVFSFAISLLLMSLTAVLPVWHAWRVDPASALRQDASRGTEARGTLRLRSGFLVAQVALTLTLSAAAVLLTRQLISESRQDLGFAAEHLITLDTHAILPGPAPVEADSSPAAQAAMQAAWQRIDQANLVRLDAVMAAAAEVPGVESVGAMLGAPMGLGGSDVSYAVEGRQAFVPGAQLHDAYIRPMTPGALSTMRVPLLRGRGFFADDREHTPRVALINQSLARQSFPGQDPLGHKLVCGYDQDLSGRTIVGVVSDIRESSPADLPYPTMYVPVAQNSRSAPDMQLIVRTQADPAAMAETLRRHLLATHPEIAVKASTMRENIGESERADQFRTTLFASFAGVSILLAAIGMYGVTSYTASERRFEFGLRIAVGSTRAQVLTLVLANAVRVALVGVGLGVALSLGLARLLASTLGQLPAFDSTAYALAACAILLIAMVSAMLPAWAAATTDPIKVLRSE
jgi:putative ABC transport system permease protein